MAIERTNLQLTADASVLQSRANVLEARATLNYVNLSTVGLKDASGTNRDFFIEDSSLYLKQNNYWYDIICVSVGPL